MNDTLIIKQTPNGLTIDTVISSRDSLNLKADFQTSISLPGNTVNIALPEKTNLETFSTWAIIIGGLAGLIGAIAAFNQLFIKDKIKSRQISELAAQTIELTKQTKIQQTRLRMLVKPRLWNNTVRSGNGNIEFDLCNRGELAFYDGYEILKGDNIEFQEWNRPVEIKKDGSIKLSGTILNKSRDEIKFIIKIFYHDQEDNKYEMKLEWGNEKIKIIETKEI